MHIPQREKFSLGGGQCNCAEQCRAQAVQGCVWRLALAPVVRGAVAAQIRLSVERCLSAVRGAAVCGLVPPLRAAEAISLYKIHLLSYCVSGLFSSAPLLLTR